MEELSTRQVTISDPFWSPRLEVNSRHAIFHQWEQLEASGCIDNFRIAAGEMDGFREGWFFATRMPTSGWTQLPVSIATHPDAGSLSSHGWVDCPARARTGRGWLYLHLQPDPLSRHTLGQFDD